MHDARGPAQLSLHVSGDELLDELAADTVRQPPARHLLAVAEDGESLRGVLEYGSQRRQPLVAHQHQEIDLRQVPRGVGIEPARSILDGVGPVEGEGLAGGELGFVQLFRRQALDRVAVQRFELGI
jgi:hypothetical protein